MTSLRFVKTQMSAAMPSAFSTIAAEICVFTNQHLTLETIET